MSTAAERQRARRILELSVKTPGLAITPAPIGKPNGPGLWHVKGMEFPPYFQNVRNALIRSGHSVESASKIAWAALRKWEHGAKTGGERGKIHPEVRMAARAALASISEKQARAHAQSHSHSNDVAEFVELANPYHGTHGHFASSSTTSPGSVKQQGRSTSTQPTVSPAQRKKYLKLAAAFQAVALSCRQQAQKIQGQLNALNALITQETNFLNTKTTAGAGTKTGANKATGTAGAKGTTTAAKKTGTTTGKVVSKSASASPTAGWTVAKTTQSLQANLKQYASLQTQQRALLVKASVADTHAKHYLSLAGG